MLPSMQRDAVLLLSSFHHVVLLLLLLSAGAKHKRSLRRCRCKVERRLCPCVERRHPRRLPAAAAAKGAAAAAESGPPKGPHSGGLPAAAAARLLRTHGHLKSAGGGPKHCSLRLLHSRRESWRTR